MWPKNNDNSCHPPLSVMVDSTTLRAARNVLCSWAAMYSNCISHKDLNREPEVLNANRTVKGGVMVANFDTAFPFLFWPIWIDSNVADRVGRCVRRRGGSCGGDTCVRVNYRWLTWVRGGGPSDRFHKAITWGSLFFFFITINHIECSFERLQDLWLHLPKIGG